MDNMLSKYYNVIDNRMHWLRCNIKWIGSVVHVRLYFSVFFMCCGFRERSSAFNILQCYR